MSELHYVTADAVATIAGSPVTPRSLEPLLDAIASNPAIELLVLQPDTPTSSVDDDFDTALFAQRVLTRLANLPIPTVAILPDGPCHGPALELALACDYRLAVAGPDTAIGFPDGPVGWGGLTRLTRLVGPRAALDLVLNRTELDARSAKRLGLVDHAYCARRANIEPLLFLDKLRGRLRKRGGGRCPLRLEAWAAGQLAAELLADIDPSIQPDGHETVRVVTAAARSLADGLAEERLSWAELRPVPVAPPTLRIQTANPVGPVTAVVATVGTADFLASWAMSAAVRGATVTTREQLELTVAAGWWKNHLTPLEADAATDRIRVADRFDRAGLVIMSDPLLPVETVEALCPPRGVIAVVGRSVAEAQQTADRPGRVIGFAPPLTSDRSKLVEVIRGPETTPDTTAYTLRWLRHIGLLPVVVSDRPNQIVRRVTAALWDEAVRLVAEGTPADVVDRTAVRIGVGLRPLRELDELGHHDVLSLVPRLTPLVATGEPFYLTSRHRLWVNESAQLLLWDARQLQAAARGKTAYAAPPDQFQTSERLLLRVVSAAVAALADEDFAGPAEVDFAVVRGAGLFAAFGGPLRYVDQVGVACVVMRLRQLAGWCGKRFSPSPELTRRVHAGEGFFSPAIHSTLRAAA